jgi:predicted acetyltransferase
VINEVDVLTPDGLRAAHELFAATLHQGSSDDGRWARVEPTYSPGRTLGVDRGGALVGTVTSFPTHLAVPGGAAVPTAAVTRVGVRADHTRRGLLTAMMRRQLADVAAAGEVLAILTATEARIYGRFGYGIAARGRRVRVRRVGGSGVRAAAPVGGPVRLLGPDELLDVLVPLYRRIGLRHAGGMTRPDSWWPLSLERRLDPRAFTLAAVHTGPDGDDGFLLAASDRPQDGDGGAALSVQDMHAAGPEAVAALWRFVLDVDLANTVQAYSRPLDEPVELLLDDPRDCTTLGVSDELWVRLVDVGAALGARTYGAGEPVLLGVRDPVLAANTGVYRIAAGGAERVGDLDGRLTPDLECDVTGLAQAYLGDRRPAELVATGWWQATGPDAVARADALFTTATAPWCGTWF